MMFSDLAKASVGSGKYAELLFHCPLLLFSFRKDGTVSNNCYDVRRFTRLISIDSSSTKTGWAVFDNAKLTSYGLIDLSKEKNSDLRIELMCKKLVLLLQEQKPDIIVIEKLNVSRNMVALRALCKVIGAVYCYAIMAKNVFYFEIQPSQWRKQLGIQKNGRKREEYKKLSIQYVKEHCGVDVNDDISDAICAGIGYIKMFSNRSD
jgi:Holliday junction resolvasome RuvABC endonuclease subunit